MDDGPAKEFLKELRGNPQERDRVKNHVLEEIVDEGAKAGYHFTASDLQSAIAAEPPITTASVEWSRPGG